MLLRRFEAHGFKSFADKVEIEFGTGVTAIVGPNGSGKSNISDAIRWVLGEQNIRNLRGAKSEDIIFAGSSERRPLNVAEVSLIFDNSDNAIPLDFNEVIITRRVYRSGESEYMINKASCRLKDIHDLLGDIGLGRESMAVISQSKVDEVLNSRPEDRRLLFEDAAGITKYKQRKRDALRKLEDTESNLTRVADIMAELGSQLEPLAESAARTEHYNRYYSELTATQISLLLHKIDRAQAMLADITCEKEILTDQYLAESTALSTSEARAEGLTHSLSALEEQLKLQENDIAITITELEKTENRIAVLQERAVQKRLAGERVGHDVAHLTEKLCEAGQEQAVLENTVSQKHRDTVSTEAEVSAAEDQLLTLTDAISEKENDMAATNDSIFVSLQETSAQRNQIVNLERDLIRFHSRRKHLIDEGLEYNTKMHAAKEQFTQYDTEYVTQSSSLEIFAAEAETSAASRQLVEQTLAAVDDTIRHVVGQITQAQSRLNVLTNMQRDLEGFNRGSKSILTSTAPWRKGICGAVAQVLNVPAAYLTAIEIALGGAMQDIIAEDEEIVRAAIHSLKQQNAGRVTFLPITNIAPRLPRDFELRAAKAPGAIGLAAALVTCESRFRNIVEHLLGRVIVAQTLETALAIAKQSGFSLKIVTLEGELINPGGAITGGSIARRESSYLGRSSEIQRLEKTTVDLRRQQEESEATFAGLREKVTAMMNKEEAISAKRQEISLRLAQLKAYCEQSQAEVVRLSKAGETIHLEITQCVSEEEQITKKLEATKTAIGLLEQADSRYKEAIVNQQIELRNLQQRKGQLSDQATEKKIALSVVKQEITSFEQALKRRQEDTRDLEARVRTLHSEYENVIQEISDTEREYDELGLLRQQLLVTKQDFDKRRFFLLGKKSEQLSELQNVEKESKELRRRTATQESRLHELQLMLTRYEYDVTNAMSQLEELHNVTLEQARLYCRPDDPQTLLAYVKQLEQEIACLGPVNPTAIEEYARVKDRYSFLDHQYQDLVTAKSHLSSIIGDIDATMVKRFIAAFQAINGHFTEIFPRLFGGGKAQIQLSDPDDPLHSGIEIFVQPPGKKQQNLALLSGGERALTVIALLFSLLSFRPAPFSVVDEIDAALDEANVQRFSEFLREFAINTQFIVVTHRKGTMEVADVMHGVTMEDSGVSRIVSVRFMDKAG